MVEEVLAMPSGNSENRMLEGMWAKQTQEPQLETSRPTSLPTNLRPILKPSTASRTISSSSTLHPSLSDTDLLVQRIHASSLSSHHQRVLLALVQVPRGHHTTYAALARFLSSSPRAVGHAMRTNPFAPLVPCHRVLAADGRIGGFKGEWKEGGKVTAEKMRLLRAEGVRFDGKGKVVGSPWRAFE